MAAAADFNLARHLLHERIRPPVGFGWLFYRKDSDLCVRAGELDALSLDSVGPA